MWGTSIRRVAGLVVEDNRAILGARRRTHQTSASPATLARGAAPSDSGTELTSRAGSVRRLAAQRQRQLTDPTKVQCRAAGALNCTVRARAATNQPVLISLHLRRNATREVRQIDTCTGWLDDWENVRVRRIPGKNGGDTP